VSAAHGWVVESSWGQILLSCYQKTVLYADGLALLDSTPQQLQTLLDCLRAFCRDYCLEVNVPKCAMVVLAGFQHAFCCDGRLKPCGG